MARTHVACMQYFTYEQMKRMKSALMEVPHLQDASTNVDILNQPCSSLGLLLYYPNAADNELNLDLRDKPSNTYAYMMYDMNGVEVLSGESPNVLETLDTSGLSNGTYFLHFYENGEVIIKHIIIQH